MIVVDTSVWIDHLSAENHELIYLLNNDMMLMHPMVIGELAVGNIRNRSSTMALLTNLPRAQVADDDAELDFIESRRLMGRGIGYIDARILFATWLTGDDSLWARDRRLVNAAHEPNIAWQP